MECQICQRRAKPNSLLCRFHYFALKRLIGRFGAWQKAADIDWKEYLKRVDASPFTGAWVLEIIAWCSASHKSEEELKVMVKRPTPAPRGP